MDKQFNCHFSFLFFLAQLWIHAVVDTIGSYYLALIFQISHVVSEVRYELFVVNAFLKPLFLIHIDTSCGFLPSRSNASKYETL